jgi:methylated-DNA-[protein]-cysteine S-methyltransferase
MNPTLSVGTLPSPLGEVGFALADDTLLWLGFEFPKQALIQLVQQRFGNLLITDFGNPVDKLKDALARYFDGEVKAIDRLQVDGAGTDFQRAVWAALREIPCGETRSYAQIAERIGRPKAVRAVGAANGQNPIWLVVPCHRVIGADGSLTGYAGGIDRKRWLLTHERRGDPALLPVR